MITDERLFPSFDFETGDVPLKQSLQPRVNRREGRPESKSRPKPRRKHPANKGPPPNRILKRPMDESQYRSLFQSEGAPSELQARRGAEASWTGRSSETQRPGELGLLRKLLNLQESESRTTTVRSPYVKKTEIRYGVPKAFPFLLIPRSILLCEFFEATPHGVLKSLFFWPEVRITLPET